MSAFVGHLTNVVFLHIGAGFLETLNAQAAGIQFWTTLIAGVGLRLMAIIFVIRLGEVISQWLQLTSRKIAAAFAYESAPSRRVAPWLSTIWTVSVVVGLNLVTYSFSAAVGDFAKSQIPVPAVPPSPTIEHQPKTPHISSCFADQCRA